MNIYSAVFHITGEWCRLYQLTKNKNNMFWTYYTSYKVNSCKQFCLENGYPFLKHTASDEIENILPFNEEEFNRAMEELCKSQK